jgi:hypothetical protein
MPQAFNETTILLVNVNILLKLLPNFWKKTIICTLGVPKYVLIDNGEKWMVKFDKMCKFF